MYRGITWKSCLCAVLLALSFHNPAAAQMQPVTVADFQAATFPDGQGHVLPYRLFVPANYNPAKKYPLVVFLHGGGGAGTDNQSQLTANPDGMVFAQPWNQVDWPCFMLAPQLPVGDWWVNENPNTTSNTPMPASPTWEMADTITVVNNLEAQYPGIDTSRLFVTGLSLGGFGTWDAIIRYPGKFAAAIPIAGGGDNTTTAPIVHFPIWAFCSSDDNVVPAVRDESMVNAIRAQGGNPFFTEYCTNGLPCYQHISWPAAYLTYGLLPWLFGPAPAGSHGGTGLTGAYYANTTLSGSPTVTRIDRALDLDWQSNAPGDVSLPATGYTVRWTGQILANTSETYTFYTSSSDGIRLWVNGVQLVNQWTGADETSSGSIALTAGQKYNVTVEYQAVTAPAYIHLSWSTPTMTKQAIPRDNLFPNASTATAIPQTTTAPVIDGNVDTAWSASAGHSINNIAGTVSSGSDLSGSWQALWDSTYLYLLVTVTDDVLMRYVTNPWDGDCVEVYIDGDNSRNTSYDANDFQYTFPWNSATIVETKHSPGSLTGVSFAQTNIAGGYRIEAKIPWATMGYPALLNGTVGVDVHIDDADTTPGTRDGKRMWNDTTDMAWSNPNLLGAGQLAAATVSAPPAPTGLTATAGNSQVVLAWNSSAGATSYNVLRSTVSGSGYASVATGIAVTNYTNTGLTNGTTYYFVVSATNSGGTSGNSVQASATPAAGGSSNTHTGTWALKGVISGTPVWKNTWQVASCASNTTYTASFWLKGAGGLIMIVDSGSWGAELKRQTFIATSTWTLCSFTFATGANTSLTFILSDGTTTAGTLYIDDCFLGIANGANVLANPGFESGGTGWQIDAGSPFSILQPGGGGDTTPPTAPGNLTSPSQTTTSVNLSWTASTDNVGVTGYNVYNGANLATTVAGLTATVSGLSPGTAYTFTVKATDAAGNLSAASNAVNVSTLTSGNTHAGVWALKGVPTGTPAWKNVWQGANCATNTNYTASFWIKGSGGVALYVYNGSWGTLNHNQTFTATSTWTQCSFTVSTGSNTQLTFALSDATSVAGTLYIDDCFLGAGTNTLANPGFESGGANWNVDTPSVWSILQNP